MAQTVHLKLQIDGNDIAGESSIMTMDREDTIECLAFNYEIVLPSKAASGRLTGRRQHKPVKITKRVDQTTPLLLKALCNNELVNEAIFRFYRPNQDGSGAEEHFYTVSLNNGFISGVKQISEDPVMAGESAPPMLEEISIIFQEITWTYENNGSTYHDIVKSKKKKK